eukprot:TRINITY_DN1389_c0_g2_i1.p1 TRINITY_DN1389_c0_g2~~TRINITY_DN1389_c0_g2_i1.p1  ORF type:complete len:455 (-),score=112.84 TRINITY_DN1389_c0_g2_i1:33-1370(-)
MASQERAARESAIWQYLVKTGHRLRAIYQKIKPTHDTRKAKISVLGRDSSEVVREKIKELYADPKVKAMDAYERLHKLHQVPGEIKKYDASHPMRMLLKISGTMMMRVLHRADFWLLNIVHTGLVLLYYVVYNLKVNPEASGVDYSWPVENNWPKATATLVDIPGVLLAFLLVFYIHVSYSRFFQQYLTCKRIDNALGEVCAMLRVHLPDEHFQSAKEVRLYLFKLLTAVHMLGYAGLRQIRDAGTDIWATHYLLDRKILTKEQISLLTPFLNGQVAFRECMMWMLRGIWKHVEAGHLPRVVGSHFTWRIWEVRTLIAELYHLSDGPIPFSYFHLLNFIILCYVVLLAYVFIFAARFLTIPIYFITLLAMLGLRELGCCISNPFGDDDVDLPVFDFVHSFYEEWRPLILLPLNPPDAEWMYSRSYLSVISAARSASSSSSFHTTE